MLQGLDLFSGIGGITKALDGYVRPVAYCEIDPYARGVLLSRMAGGAIPAAPVWDDVSSLRGGMLPNVDIIYGGFPCQDISIAGRREGLEGKRSGLFFEIMRLARETGAEWIFLENVPNIRTKGLGRVLEELDIFGYDCRWGLLSAADVGANHKRERWFLLAHTQSKQNRRICESGAPQNGSTGTSEGQSAELADAGRESSTQENTGISTIGESRNTRSDDSRGNGGSFPRNDWWVSEPNVGRVAYGVSKRVDRLRALGNAVVPAQAREAFERLMGLR